MKIKTNELTGAALDWAVCLALGRTDMRVDPDDGEMMAQDDFDYSIDWAQGGPIIERERITIRFWEGESDVDAYKWDTPSSTGPTPLIAAMRCFVASKLGDDVDVPEELCPPTA